MTEKDIEEAQKSIEMQVQQIKKLKEAAKNAARNCDIITKAVEELQKVVINQQKVIVNHMTGVKNGGAAKKEKK
jgi:capsid protein